jgi:hypothetical protein
MTTPGVDEMESFLNLLELERLQLVEAIMQSERGYYESDLAKLSVHSGAIQSVREAIAWRKDFDSR